MLKSLHVELPLITRVVIWISENFPTKGIYVLIGLIFIVVVSMMTYRRNGAMRSLCHVIISRVPIVGPIVCNYSASVFLRSCGSLIESGVPSDEAYASTSSTVSLLPLRNSLSAKATSIARGVAMGTALSDKTLRLPAYVAPLLLAGGSSGALGTSALRAAGIIDRDIEHALKRLTSLIEPCMMLVLGLAVGAIALSIMMPIYDISRVLQH